MNAKPTLFKVTSTSGDTICKMLKNINITAQVTKNAIRCFFEHFFILFPLIIGLIHTTMFFFYYIIFLLSCKNLSFIEIAPTTQYYCRCLPPLLQFYSSDLPPLSYITIINQIIPLIPY